MTGLVGLALTDMFILWGNAGYTNYLAKMHLGQLGHGFLSNGTHMPDRH